MAIKKLNQTLISEGLAWLRRGMILVLIGMLLTVVFYALSGVSAYSVLSKSLDVANVQTDIASAGQSAVDTINGLGLEPGVTDVYSGYSGSIDVNSMVSGLMTDSLRLMVVVGLLILFQSVSIALSAMGAGFIIFGTCKASRASLVFKPTFHIAIAYACTLALQLFGLAYFILGVIGSVGSIVCYILLVLKSSRDVLDAMPESRISKCGPLYKMQSDIRGMYVQVGVSVGMAVFLFLGGGVIGAMCSNTTVMLWLFVIAFGLAALSVIFAIGRWVNTGVTYIRFLRSANAMICDDISDTYEKETTENEEN